MRDKIDAVTRVLLVSLMGLLVIVVGWQVFSRYVLNAPSTFTDEIARFLLIWVSLLGIAYYAGMNKHVAIDILPSRLQPAARLKLNILINVLIIAFALSVLVIGGGILVYTNYIYMQLTPALQLPMMVIYLIGPISGLLVIYYKLSDIINMIQAGPDETNPEQY